MNLPGHLKTDLKNAISRAHTHTQNLQVSAAHHHTKVHFVYSTFRPAIQELVCKDRCRKSNDKPCTSKLTGMPKAQACLRTACESSFPLYLQNLPLTEISRTNSCHNSHNKRTLTIQQTTLTTFETQLKCQNKAGLHNLSSCGP